MNKLRKYFQAYHPIVHIMMLGTVFISLTSSMSIPFLAIYLSETSQLDFATIGLIIGAGPLAGTFCGFIGGFLSDFFGRRRLMIISLLVLAIVFIGFVYIESPLFLLFLSILRGVSTSFFNTISKALIGDLTPEDQRFRVFSTRYSAMNLGFSIGPMVGAFLGIGGSSITFLLTSSVYLVYSIILVFLFQSFSVQQNTELNAERISLAQAWNVVRSDKVLFFFILGGIMLTTVHGQISVPLSQYLKENIVDGVKLFGLLMSINGVTVIILQVPLTRWSEKFSIFHRIILGSSLLTLGAVGFAFSAGWAGFILSMIIFTLAEILLVPAEYTQIDQITPHGMRGTYYGAQSFSEFGNFLGPWIGGILLSAYGGTTMFLTLGAISIASLFFFSKGRKLVRR
ncbi:MFS transporter [Bacillus atrophaeus]|uniref:MDR family MFS transporter n=1 Tax=Bacillus atrophaeus TaxID=1452 RepID=UPI00077A139B|nr:MFS transporter [Bacillus atrophaeus]KXZ16320.1 hypothetical protein AXI57_09025 [Bacillus atrophaeus]MCY8837404.1 MFS transporter [Bacillus atrophaeus]MEC5220212.1 MFS transporter [Bacillus atrophaeus]MED4580434.1 MFS transporter [Bacillus atrophaeus]MED4720846.1 MFS transporter [Bacillus atrophaeus]